MNQVFKYIRNFYIKEFNLFYLLVILLMLGILIYFNYWHALERKYAASGKTKWAQLTGYYILYLVPFATAFLLQLLFYKDCDYYKDGWFWAILLLAPAFFSLRVNFDFQSDWVKSTFAGPALPYYRACINWIIRVFVLLVPVSLIWFLKDAGEQPLYGLKKLDSLKPYLLMILIMIPLIALASTQKDFLATYPKAKMLDNITGVSKWRYVFFELSYGFDFISIEMFFRGFLVLALMRICGEHCIIPIACFYCTIHLGKPMGEAISSFFGGMLLGIVSYNTGSIFGGLIVHLGIAWLMEAGGFVGHIFNKVK